MSSAAFPKHRVRPLLRTARYIPLSQLAARVRFVILRRLYAAAPKTPILLATREATGCAAAQRLPSLPFELLAPEGAESLGERAAAFSQGRFTYLGQEVDFSSGIRWHRRDASRLWQFNLHYLGVLLDLVLAGHLDDARRILASWTASFGAVWDPIAWHPYPASLRLVNLCLSAGHAGSFKVMGECTASLAAAHAAYLLRHMEWDLRGNHLLENACALMIAGRFLRGPLARRSETIARTVLEREVKEQILADGCHFELSPMYHAMVMHRLLQLIWLLGSEDPLVRCALRPAMSRMMSFLQGILCPDGDIPLLGDSVRGFAPHPQALLQLARTLVVDPPGPDRRRSFPDSGLHVLNSGRLWAIFDAGPVCPDYLPGHGQADSLTIEVWCGDACVVGDPGVHDYTGPERAWGRSSRAHSAITVDNEDTSEVYGSFRVGGRARVTSVAFLKEGITATLEPFGRQARFVRLLRRSSVMPASLEIIDRVGGSLAGSIVRSRLHLHPKTAVEAVSADHRDVIVRSDGAVVRIRADHPVYMESGRASRQFGMIERTVIIVQELKSCETAAGEGRFVIEPLH